ncbi:hypothetical protein BJ508DRAFT_333801 [Ascobolus immersus RN42]|uniref:Uncharacterized protein n=1 Tax=Ascobolus immersus RN42 TaxID=1160509 RepID=A0A3N4HMC8_ASCIM|nr:hypothetical protein BJ508DRAFT_333801 [Ascobolus immersus RN42]
MSNKVCKSSNNMLFRIINLRIRQLEYQQRLDDFDARLDAAKAHYNAQNTTRKLSETENCSFEEWSKRDIRKGWPAITPTNIEEEEERMAPLELALEKKLLDLQLIEEAIQTERIAFATPHLPNQIPIIDPSYSMQQRVRRMQTKAAISHTRAQCFNARLREMKAELPRIFGVQGNFEADHLELQIDESIEVTEENVVFWECELPRREQRMESSTAFMAHVEAQIKMEKVFSKYMGRRFGGTKR